MSTPTQDLTPTQIDREMQAFSAKRLGGTPLTPAEAGRYYDLQKARQKSLPKPQTWRVRKCKH